MTDSDWSMLSYVVGGLIAGLVSVHRASSKRKINAPPVTNGIICKTEEELDVALHALVDLVSESLIIPKERLNKHVRFLEDLRVPPGELLHLMDEIADHFSIETPQGIETFGDLLNLIGLTPSTPHTD